MRKNHPKVPTVYTFVISSYIATFAHILFDFDFYNNLKIFFTCEQFYGLCQYS